MVVRWTSLASARIQEIFNFYEEKNERIAQKIALEIRSSVEMLKFFPAMASIDDSIVGCPHTLRSLVVVNGLFKVVYLIDEKADEIIIVTIWDCRKNPIRISDELKYGTK